MKRHGAIAAVLTVVLGVGAFVVARAPHSRSAPVPSAAHLEPMVPDEDEERAPSFRMPRGEPAALDCASAQTIVKQVRAQIAYAPPTVDGAELAKGTSDWLDPNGMWSAAEDAPIEAVLARYGHALARELEGEPCRTPSEIAKALQPWIAELRAIFDGARGEDAEALARPLEPSAPARVLARKLGEAASSAPPEAKAYATAARGHYFPDYSVERWSSIVLAAAVRAYIPLVDPHGAWAPSDEESSVYEVDLEAHPAQRSWERATPTALGLRLDAGAAAPLAQDDVILEVDGLSLAGLGPELLDQIAFASAAAPHPVLVWREKKLVRLQTAPPAPAVASAPSPHDLPSARLRFGASEVLFLTPHDVEDDLGSLLGRTIEREKARKPAGIVLDLRGNGGGSTDGAIEALALFMPRASLFPMKRRDGTIETDRAPDAPESERWSGPVATLVDGATASAAEMIAGALAAYRRGPTVGARTYGKGCAQEYVEDDAHLGLLRMTTLLYALPDGSPVQRVGLTPLLELGWKAPAPDRESTLPHAPPAWRGPDVRDRDSRWETPWPSATEIGPCPADPALCQALQALSGWTPHKPTSRRR